MAGCRKPCVECPFSRKVEPGGTGGTDPSVYVGQAFGPFLLPCHMDPDYYKNRRSPELLQCAGAASFRAHIGVDRLLPEFLLHLPADKELVFSNPAELLAHHGKMTLSEAEEFLRSNTPIKLLRIELMKNGAQIVEPPEPHSD